MELLLNLLWLAMVVPAIWMWCRPRVGRQRIGRFHSALLLSCVLVLLFPAISASDDLQPMRVEVEDSSPSKRVIQHAANHQGSTVLQGFGHFWAVLVSARWLEPGYHEAGPVSLVSLFLRKTAHAHAMDARGPPSFHLA